MEKHDAVSGEETWKKMTSSARKVLWSSSAGQARYCYTKERKRWATQLKTRHVLHPSSSLSFAFPEKLITYIYTELRKFLTKDKPSNLAQQIPPEMQSWTWRFLLPYRSNCFAFQEGNHIKRIVNTRNVSVFQNYYSLQWVTFPSGSYSSPKVIQSIRFRKFVRTSVECRASEQAFSRCSFYTHLSAVSISDGRKGFQKFCCFPSSKNDKGKTCLKKYISKNLELVNNPR